MCLRAKVLRAQMRYERTAKGQRARFYGLLAEATREHTAHWRN